MAGENRTPNQKIGEVAHAQDQANSTTGHKPPHGPGAPHDDEAVRAKPDKDPRKKNAGEF